jgi:hypothetical protein
MSEAELAGAEQGSDNVDAPTEATPAEATTETIDTGWRESIADENARKLAERYNDPAAVANALYEANRELSQRVKLPGKDADEETVAKFNKALGVPESIEGYAIERPEHLAPEEFESEESQAVLGNVLEAMRAKGASKPVVDAMLEQYWAMDAAAKAETARRDDAAAEEGEATLRKNWGSDYDANMAFANRAIEQNPALADIELRDNTLLGSHPDFVRLAATLGRLTSEGAPQAGLQGTEAGVNLQQEYDRLTTDIHTAHVSGDVSKANQLDAQRRRISEQLHGNQSIA